MSGSKHSRSDPSVREGQLRRMLDAAVVAANRGGYQQATVSAIIAEAGVSRPTFYEHFGNREASLIAAARGAQQRLAAKVRASLNEAPGCDALRVAVAALIEHAGTFPEETRFLADEMLAGGPEALDVRDRGVIDLGASVEDRLVGVSHAGPPDLPAGIVLGGVARLIASRLRRGETEHTAFAAAVDRWIGSYRRPVEEHRRRSLSPHPHPSPSPYVPDAPIGAGEDPRERILFAVAELAEINGYAALTVADVTVRASVNSRVFYRLFADKHEAFAAVHELGFRHIMQATAEAFFSGSDWPQRNWEAGRAFTQFLARNPMVASVGFVEAYAAGPGAVQRLEDSRSAFGMLLQDGNRGLAPEERPGLIAVEAIVSTIFEIVYRHARARATYELPRLLGFLTYLVLVPFDTVGGVEALIERELEPLLPQSEANSEPAVVG
jgi:AcrR family transcriptional regulator